MHEARPEEVAAVRVADEVHLERDLEFEIAGTKLLMKQNPNTFQHGTTVWDSSKVLAKYLEKHRRHYGPRKLKGKKACELGAGCGLLGISFTLLGCDVILTDIPEVLPYLKENVLANLSTDNVLDSSSCGKATVQEFVWGQQSPAESEGPFDFIIGSDLVYDEHVIVPLIETINQIATEKIILANERRCEDVDKAFLRLVDQHFIWKKVPAIKYHQDYRKEAISIFHMKKKKRPS